MSLFAEDDQQQMPEKARVSILERAVPAISFGLASLSGVIGAVITIRVFTVLKEAENAGIDAIAEGLSTINFLMLALLGTGIVFGVVGIVLVVIRMSTNQAKSSPPGFIYLAAGLPNMISPILVAYAWAAVVDIVLGRSADDPTETGAWVASLMVAAVPIGIAAILLLMPFILVPFSARRGMKLTSIAALTAVVGCTAAIALNIMGLTDTLLKGAKAAYGGD